MPGINEVGGWVGLSASSDHTSHSTRSKWTSDDPSRFEMDGPSIFKIKDPSRFEMVRARSRSRFQEGSKL